jgi:prophage regulatory protein
LTGNEYLDSKGLERLTGTRASTWRYWASRNEGPTSFKLGRRRVWKRSVVEEWLAEQQAASDTPTTFGV